MTCCVKNNQCPSTLLRFTGDITLESFSKFFEIYDILWYPDIYPITKGKKIKIVGLCFAFIEMYII